MRRLVVAAVALAAAGCSQDTTRFVGFLGDPQAPPEKKATYAPTYGDGKGSGKEIKETSLPPVKRTAKDEPPPSGKPRYVKTADFGGKGTADPPSPWPWANGKPKYSGKPLWTDEEELPWPDAKEKAKKSSFQGHYTTRRGDTLAGIAERFKVSLGELKRVNGLAGDQSRVKAGTVLAIPAPMGGPPRVVQVKRVTVPTPKLASVAPPVPKLVKPGDFDDEPKTSPPETKAPPKGGVKKADTTKDTAKDTTKDTGKETTAGLKFRWPVVGAKVLSTFGLQPDGSRNEGIKLAVPLNIDIHAAEGGRVHYAGDGLKGYGNLILIRHPNGWVSTYAHASKMLVKVGDDVKRGQVIAKSGKTGPVDVPQLGFELRKGSTPVNPLEYLPK